MPKQMDKADEAKVTEIRDNFKEDFEHWDPIYKDGDLNMKFIAGDPWTSEDRRAREGAGRPVVTFDELGQYLNQAQNEVRMNPRAPQFSPESEGANDETARFYGNHFRRTEYLSNAQEAYTTAFDNALSRGFSFVRLKFEFEHPRSFYQRMVIEPVPNPIACYPDCNSVRADGSDWKRFTFIERYTKAQFKKDFPEAEFTDFSAEQIANVGATWLGQNHVQVAEYWEVETEERKLIDFDVPATRQKPQRQVTWLEGDGPKPRGGKVVQERVTEVRTVCKYFTNGVELLKKGGKTKHYELGTMIPFAPCYGKMIWVNEGGGPKRKILSMVTLAREPYAAYCFAAACELEAVGTITKNPYWAYEGQLDATAKNRIKQSLHEPVAVLEAKAMIQGMPGTLLPLPQRNPMAVDLSAYATVKEGARRAIQAAMGWTPLPSQAQRRNEKSGVALKQIEESGQKGSYHFTDHYNDMLRRIGVIYEDSADKFLDAQREVITLEADKTVKRVMINVPKDYEAPEGVETLESTKGRHAVIVDIGPEVESERKEAGQFLDNFIASPLFSTLEPPKRDKLLAMGIKERIMGPMGSKMAEVIDPVKDGNQPPPEQLMAMLKEAQEVIIPGFEQQIQKLMAERAAKTVETQGKLAVTAAQDKTKLMIAEMQTEQKREDSDDDNRTTILIAEKKAQIELLKLQLEEVKLKADIRQSAAQMDHDEAMTERDHEEAEKGRLAVSAENAANRDAAAQQAEASE